MLTLVRSHPSHIELAAMRARRRADLLVQYAILAANYKPATATKAARDYWTKLLEDLAGLTDVDALENARLTHEPQRAAGIAREAARLWTAKAEVLESATCSG